MGFDTHDVSVAGVSLEPAYERCVSPRDCDVIECVETAPKRDDPAPGTAFIRRDADPPLVGNGDVPRGDDAVASAGREHDVAEPVSVLEGVRALPASIP